jgi:hypothetical protein
MDSQIRRLIAAHGGYAYEIAGCIVAFFEDSQVSRAFSALLAHRAEVTVECCGTQLSFPASARLAYVESQTPDCLPTSPRELDPIARTRAVWSLFRRRPGRHPVGEVSPTDGTEQGPLNELHFVRAPLSATPTRP